MFNTPFPSYAPIEMVFSVEETVLTKIRCQKTDHNFGRIFYLSAINYLWGTKFLILFVNNIYIMYYDLIY